MAFAWGQVKGAALLLGIHLFEVCVFRDGEKQDEYFEAGTSNARAGESWHNRKLPDETPSSLALDYGIRPAFENDRHHRPNYRGYDQSPTFAVQRLIADMAIAVGFTAGMDFSKPDPPHLEFHPGFVRESGLRGSLESQMHNFHLKLREEGIAA